MLEDQRGYQPVGVLVYHGKLSPADRKNITLTFGVLAYYLMASALYQQQLKGVCLTQETFERAKSILNLSSLHTGHGTGFPGNTASLPAVAAYLASEQCV